ncbi:MAG: YraN family protein [Rhizobiaceae bacterium]|nr:YraN family protein [Rhizobiaceae bacterium]
MDSKSAKNARRKAQFKGYLAEYLAATYLILKGYRIANMRYKTKLGEIDIIARKKDLAIFVEVKARADVQKGVDAVTYPSQKRIKNASDIWLSKQKNSHLISLRYDIIVIRPLQLPVHFLDAF